MFTPLITHDSDGTALAAPVDAARRNGAAYKTRTIDDLRIKDDRLLAAIEGTGHLLFDGGMGTMLQAAGMKAGALPEVLNFEEPQVITDIQRQYVEAGCDVITANTFGANAHKLDGAATVADVFAAAVTCAREAGAHYVAGDIGPIGALLRPLGTLSFDEAYNLFAEEVRAGVAAGVDLFIIETMTDLAEIKAAVLACRENSDLPVFATMTFEEDLPGNESRGGRHHARRYRRRRFGHQLQPGTGRATRTRRTYAHRYRQAYYGAGQRRTAPRGRRRQHRL